MQEPEWPTTTPVPLPEIPSSESSNSSPTPPDASPEILSFSSPVPFPVPVPERSQDLSQLPGIEPLLEIPSRDLSQLPEVKDQSSKGVEPLQPSRLMSPNAAALKELPKAAARLENFGSHH